MVLMEINKLRCLLLDQVLKRQYKILERFQSKELYQLINHRRNEEQVKMREKSKFDSNDSKQR